MRLISHTLFVQVEQQMAAPCGRWEHSLPTKQQTSLEISYAPFGSAGVHCPPFACRATDIARDQLCTLRVGWPVSYAPFGPAGRQLCTLWVGWSALSTARRIEISNAPSGSAGSALHPRGRAGHQCQPVRALHQFCSQAVDVARELLMGL